MIKFDFKNEDGIALFFTIAVVSVMSIMVASIAKINFRENLSAFSFSESTQAFFAADSAMNCFENNSFIDSDLKKITCGTIEISFVQDSVRNDIYKAEHEFIDGLCSILIIDNVFGTAAVSNSKIYAFGYNRSCNDIHDAFDSNNTPHLKRLIQERSILKEAPSIFSVEPPVGDI